MPPLLPDPCVADLMLAGYNVVHVHCDACRCIRERSWKQIGKLDLAWTLTELAAHLRCRRCRTRPARSGLKIGRRMDRITPTLEFYGEGQPDADGMAQTLADAKK